MNGEMEFFENCGSVPIKTSQRKCGKPVLNERPKPQPTKEQIRSNFSTNYDSLLAYNEMVEDLIERN